MRYVIDTKSVLRYFYKEVDRNSLQKMRGGL